MRAFPGPVAGQTSKTHTQKSGQTAFRFPAWGWTTTTPDEQAGVLCHLLALLREGRGEHERLPKVLHSVVAMGTFEVTCGSLLKPY